MEETSYYSVKLYTSDGCAYEGMDEETVTRLRTELGRETTYITEEQYKELLRAQEENVSE